MHTSGTPIELSDKQTLSADNPKVEMSSYQKLISKLLGLSPNHPDISYSVNVLSQFMHSPRRSHFHSALRVLWYLKETTVLGLSLKKKDQLDLTLYRGSNFSRSLTDRRSTTDCCTMLGGNLVTWRSNKKNVVCKSSTEVEFSDYQVILMKSYG